MGLHTNFTSDRRRVAQPPRADTTESGDASFQPVGVAAHEQEVMSLARQLSRASVVAHAPASGTSSDQTTLADDRAVNVFKLDPLADDIFNPASSSFSASAFIKMLLKLQRTADGESLDRTSGLAFRNLNVHGFNSGTDYQKTFFSTWFSIGGLVRKAVGRSTVQRIQILDGLDGIIRSGEMLVVLGPPGSGCSTFLKTITGNTHGFTIDGASDLNYQGISYEKMSTRFRGEASYAGEVDVHFPMLSVGDTLAFAAEARAPRTIPGGVSRSEYAQVLRDVVMAVFGIAHTKNTRVGNDYVRGVSGGERKRVTISEAALTGAPLGAWDNCTRGLDSANAVEFCKVLRLSTELTGASAAVSIYQSPQTAYELFDKVLLLYEGRQIYFGRTTDAKQFFVEMGFECADRMTDPDFLTSLTSPIERRARAGFENIVPRTPDEFACAWKSSTVYRQLQDELAHYQKEFPLDGAHLEHFQRSRRAEQSRLLSKKSPYTMSYPQQICLCLRRGWKLLLGDPSLAVEEILGNTALGLIIASVFYNMQETTASFFQRGVLVFLAILLAAFASALEILALYAQRPIVEKHVSYALYRPSAEAFASIVVGLPYKITNCIVFNIIIYFMSNLRREPGAFFFYLFVNFLTTMTMSGLFRFTASVSRTVAQAMAPSALLILALVIYTGFVVPIDYMLGWARWINYLDPVAYAFEALMVNEFSGRSFSCSAFVPSGAGYTALDSLSTVCSAVGAVAGSATVSGDTYIATAFRHFAGNKWRDVGILIAFGIGLTAAHIVATELISGEKSRGEVLVFPRRHIPKQLGASPSDIESKTDTRLKATTSRGEKTVTDLIQRQTAIFSWQDVNYSVKIKSETRQILNSVDGWVKPGQMTALMGVSGAGKTTLLDVLATRVKVGVVSGEMLVDGRPRDASFQRNTGYVQQQDLHLETSTVREALTFSAILRQPAHVPRSEKVAYVENVISLLEMEEYADAVVGVPGVGLNVEQRKRLTIGVELAAKPQLLLFLDEPTSGLDSQTSWSICNLLDKLASSGQAILCTIHQPSAMLFSRFDRLLFLAKGGRTVYFGDIGDNAATLLDYFERNGAPRCPPAENPAEYILSAIGAAPGSHSDVDWPTVWKESTERQGVLAELAAIKSERSMIEPRTAAEGAYREFAAPLFTQYLEVQKRIFAQYWRSPAYLWSKTAICVGAGLFIGLSFLNAPNTRQGVQNQMFSIFMLLTIFGEIVGQIMPEFVKQRELFEVREQPAKIYSWKVFMASSLVAELPWNTLMSLLIFVTYYYPIGLYRNAEPTNNVHLRGFEFFVCVWQFMLFSSTSAHAVVAFHDSAQAGANFANLLFSLCLIFCGVLATPATFPRFWIFMYHVNPFRYLIEGILASGISDTSIVCAANELLRFQPTGGQTCGEFMSTFIQANGGYLVNPTAMSDCSFCQISETNTFLAGLGMNPSLVPRNIGILFGFILFNIGAALMFYYISRVPKKSRSKQ